MKYAIVLANDGDQYALLKTDNEDRVKAMAILCQSHIHKLYPQAICEISIDRGFNLRVEMHPDKDAILDRLRAYEFPLPADTKVIDGEWSRDT